MKKILLVFLFMVLIFNLNAAAQSELAMSIRNHLLVIEEYEGHFPEGENVGFYQELIEFYDQRHHRSIWFGEEKLKNDPKSLIKEIKNSYFEGLNPSDYHLAIIESCINEDSLFSEEHLDKRALMDILLTNAYLSLASDYLNGKIDAEIIIDDYNYQAESLEAQKLLSYLTNEKIEISKAINNQLPKTDNYEQLKEKLAYYRDSGKIEAWPKIELGESLGIGAAGIRVSQLIKNLDARNYLNIEGLKYKDQFNQNVKWAVQQFQLDNGLKSDGVVGKKTFTALNIPLEYRIKQLIINMERWRWLPENLGSRYIYVNIADYNLKLYEDNQVIMQMKTIVGKEQRSTPVFSDTIKYLVINPYWYVPKSIAVEDKLPLIKEDYSYLKENNYSLFQYTGNNKLEEIDPAEVNWPKIDEDNFNYLLRQNPGDNNALGRIKFMFPNKFSIYLHDTPGRYLFSENERGFSSGCIRIEKPIDLAEYLLNDQEKWNRENIEEEMENDKEKTVYLKNPIKIYLQYNTAWIDSFGRLNFREDIYKRDQKIIEEYF
ncbi:L,D-transpeptidase family protein [Halanaerobium congolense]|uniref:Murein L,D-transpeptidase YcbB/YkuD n=1 Tax=Halanaerobium congolense TaxID=54121 RepID=A0A1G6RY07_9FIRM|nr:L,D-transpeptidase family protein [Halanaerobium congolense]PXV67956.1 murein L,D-transpeptidase YcbB/YkuD [Halanaerobium congolense]TDS27597.1 murein L,D-transpeptidase YcbB/YkuD [Halanaerobium congolense]TDX43570.1 murein L,D-transpeptidase YcbB/YkuD [Halanaerobium congolense]SDD09552.1 Murein L,D-transpeptidase YcbB/YkuD [Halanaerobium congolense]SDH54938.1 Murein L,D-transpeptidase YcbB/YkuD [Halanaerobium congolense]